jgi:hypothetical protein
VNAAIFAMLLTAYSVSVGGPSIQPALGQVFAPWPSFTFLIVAKCAPTDYLCIIPQLGVNAVVAPLLGLVYLAQLAFSAVTRINIFGGIMSTVLFGPSFNSFGIPFLPIFEAAIVLIGAIEVFRLFRGNASAGTL